MKKNERMPLLVKNAHNQKSETPFEVAKLTLPFTVSRIALTTGIFLQNKIISTGGQAAITARGLTSAYEGFTMGTSSNMLNMIGAELSTANALPQEHMPYFTRATPYIIRRGFILSALLSIPTLALTAIGDKALSALLNNDDDIKIIQKYFYASLPLIPATLFFVLEQQIAMANSRSIPVAVFVLSYSTLATVLSYIFIQKIDGYPESKDLEWMAYALSIAAWSNVIAFGAYLKYSKNFKSFALFKPLPFHFYEELKALGNLLKLSTPIGLQTGIDELTNFLLATLIGQSGDKEFTANQIVFLYCAFLSIFSQSAAQVTLILTSKEAATHSFTRSKKTTYMSMFSAAALCGLFLTALILLGNNIATPFIDTNDTENEELLALMNSLLLIGGIEKVIGCFKEVTIGALRGFKDTQFPMYLGVLGSAMQLTLAYSLYYTTSLGSVGVYIARAASTAVMIPPLLYRFHSYISDKLTNKKNQNGSSYLPSFTNFISRFAAPETPQPLTRYVTIERPTSIPTQSLVR